MSNPLQPQENKSKGIISAGFWLGDDSSSVNLNRFWLYLASIVVTLCLLCLIRAARSV